MAEIPKAGPGRLVAVAMAPGPEWLTLLTRIWDAGAAALPVDHRSTRREAERLLDLARPDSLVDRHGRVSRRAGGAGVDEAVSLVMPTSGTTGAPRLVEITSEALLAAVTASLRRLDAGPDDGWLCCLPLSHMGGMLVVARAALLGVPVTVHARFDPELFGRAREARFTSVVPTMLLRLLEHGADLRRFRAILVGGTGLPESLARRAGSAGASIARTYGLTESCGGVVYDGIPLEGIDVRIGDDDDVQLRGRTIFRGYRFDADATAEAFTSDGWLRTGDAGDIVDGRLVVHGRMDDAILTGGEKVWPAEVEDVLRDAPGVAEVAVVGRPDPEWGQRVVAHVVPSDRSRPPTLESLRDAVGARLARYKAPRELVLVDALPATRSGKPIRPSRSATGRTSRAP